MGRKCKVCQHPRLLEINDDLLRGVPLIEISRRYNVPYESLKRHRKNHFQESLAESRERVIKHMGAKFRTTLEYYDALLEHFLQHPEIKEGMTLSHVLQILEKRSQLLGEQKQPPRVEIRWGVGLEANEDGVDTITIKIPKEKREEHGGGDTNPETG